MTPIFRLIALAIVGTCATGCSTEVARVEFGQPLVTMMQKEPGIHVTATALDSSGKPIEKAKIVFAVANPSVATVDATGLVKAIGSGDTTLTATAGKITASIPVKVLLPTSIAITPPEMHLEGLDSVAITAKVLDDRGHEIQPPMDIQWASSSSAIVGLWQGRATANAFGEAVLTATAGALKATVKVQVVPKRLFALPTPPTRQKIQAALDRGFAWNSQAPGNITLIHSIVNYESGDGPGVECKNAPVTVTSSSIKWTCTLEFTAGDGTRVPSADKEASFELPVDLISDDLIVLHDEDKNRLVLPLPNCRATSLRGAQYSDCGTGRDATLVELMPSATDPALYNAVVAWVKGLSAPDGDDWAFLDGPRAKTPRVESEIFYSEAGETAAQQLAEKIAPILGPISAKRWPGTSLYDVVLVVGSKKAGPGK